MRAAILISGYLRTFRTNIPRIRKSILNKFSQVDVYIHVTKNEGQDDRYLNPSNFDADLEFISRELQPVSLVCEENQNLSESRRLNDVMNLWFKYYKLNLLKIATEAAQGPYDVVIKYRPDLDIISSNLFEEDLTRDVVYLPEESLMDKSKLVSPSDPYLCDIFAYGNSAVMDRYFDVFKHIKNLVAKYGAVSETLLYRYLNDSKINYQQLPIAYNVLLSSCNIFAICGDSGSGKSTLSQVLKSFFGSSFTVEGDRYHKWERHDENWKHLTHLNPESNYLTKMSQDIFDLKVGKKVYQVDYDHKTGKFTDQEQIESADNIIVCGLNSLYTENNHIYNLKIFIDTDERFTTMWKVRRDVKERGHSVDHVMSQIKKRREDYEKFIFPQRALSDLVIKFFPKSEGLEPLDSDENIALSLSIKASFPIQELLNKFLEQGIKFELKKSNEFYDILFMSYQPITVWDGLGVPTFNNFYDYIVYAIIKLKTA
jgi:uridine kinase